MNFLHFRLIAGLLLAFAIASFSHGTTTDESSAHEQANTATDITPPKITSIQTVKLGDSQPGYFFEIVKKTPKIDGPSSVAVPYATELELVVDIIKKLTRERVEELTEQGITNISYKLSTLVHIEPG
jgi:hypothetical protein